MKTDAELLGDFAATRAETAFAELVARHLDLVFSAALRQVGSDVHLAEDVAQTVFADLARKADTLRLRGALAGWLYTSAHHAAAKTVRTEQRRRAREEEAQAMQALTNTDEVAVDWERLRGVLDEAMLELGGTDRAAVVLRYFADRSFAEVGAELALTEDTARKRVERALDKLHALLAKRGIASTASAVGLALSQHAVTAAPAGLAGTVSGSALAGVAAGGVGAGGLAGIFFMNKLGVGLAAVAAVALTATALWERRERERLDGEIVELRRSETVAIAAAESAERSVAELRRVATEVEAAIGRERAVASAIPTTSPPPTLTELTTLDSRYAGLLRRLSLAPEQRGRLKRLLVERERQEREVAQLARQHGLDLRKLTGRDLDALHAIRNSPVHAQIRELLDADGYRAFESYVRTLRYRGRYAELDRILAYSPEPLRDEQIDQLAAWTDEVTALRNRALSEFDDFFPPEVLVQARSILSPLQMEKLETIRAGRMARGQVLARNREAAEKGLIRLSAQSAKDYPTRTVKRPANP